MRLDEAIGLYSFLGEVKVTGMETEEILKVVKARRALKPHVDQWTSFIGDLQDKMKEGVDLQDGKAVKELEERLNRAAAPELGKEVGVSLEKLSDEAVAAILRENGIKARELESVLGAMM